MGHACVAFLFVSILRFFAFFAFFVFVLLCFSGMERDLEKGASTIPTKLPK